MGNKVSQISHPPECIRKTILSGTEVEIESIKEQILPDHMPVLCFLILRNVEEYDEGIDITSVFKNLVKNGHDINNFDADGNNSLMYACVHDKFDIVQFLIEKGININTQNFKGQTALMMCNSYNVAKLLIDKGANYKLLDDRGFNTFMYLCQINSNTLYELMMKNGCRINLNSFRPQIIIPEEILLRILENVNTFTVDHIFDGDDKTSFFPCTIFMYACKYKYLKSAIIIINKRPAIMIKNAYGNTVKEFMDIDMKAILLPLIRSNG